MRSNKAIAISLFALLAGLSWFGTARAADDATSKKLVEYYRRKANIPPAATVEVKSMKDAPIKGAKQGVMSAGGRDVMFLLSDDGKYVIFGDIEDLSVDPFSAVMKKIDL